MLRQQVQSADGMLIVLFAGGSYFAWFPLRGLISDNWQQLSWPAAIADYFWRADAVRLLEKPGVHHVDLRGEMGDGYRAACFMAGAAMILVGIIGSWSGRQPSPSRSLSDGSTSG